MNGMSAWICRGSALLGALLITLGSAPVPRAVRPISAFSVDRTHEPPPPKPGDDDKRPKPKPKRSIFAQEITRASVDA